VLLLNTCLTVRAASAGSHAKRGWESFTDKVVDAVDRWGGANVDKATGGVGRGVVFLCWGAWAAKRTDKLDKVRRASLFLSISISLSICFSLSTSTFDSQLPFLFLSRALSVY
jgi:uracil DNA glycosylase